MNALKSSCFFCIIAGLFFSGAFGALTGSVAMQFGFDHTVSGALAGVVGSFATQMFNLVCLLLETRYKGKPKS